MTHMRAFTAVLALAGVALLAAVPQQQPPAGGQTQQPDTIITRIGDTSGPPRLAVPEFIPLSSDADVVAAAKTIAQVLWDDLDYEKEFYLLPHDILKTVPRPANADQVALNRWKELQADAVIVGTVAKTATASSSRPGC